MRILYLLLRVLLLCLLLQPTVEAKKKEKKKPIQLTRELLNLCSNQPSIARSQETPLKWLVAASGEASITLRSSPQHQAACWILYKDKKSKGRSQKLLLQRYALSVLHFATTKSNTTAWDWPMAVDEPKMVAKHGDWLHPKLHECSWYGVRCHPHSKIIYELKLGYLKLDGLIPREMGLLTALQDLDLRANDFQGVVPLKMIMNLKQIRYLRLHMNGFFGTFFHKEITNMKKLKELYLFGNYFGGTISPVLSELKELTNIDLYANQLEGTIPSELGKLKKLQSLDLHDNNLVGSVPKEICKLNLKELVVDCLGPKPEVKCDCCTICCRGLPDFKCVDQKTGQEIQ